MATTGKPNIHLYSASTANGIKASILLEELGLPYKVTKIDISKNTQKEPWFLEINPNGRIPALTDTFDDGEQIRIFESGSILQYLVHRYDKDHQLSYPRGSREYWEVNNWVCVARFFICYTKCLGKSFRLTILYSWCGKWVVWGLCKVRQFTSIVS